MWNWNSSGSDDKTLDGMAMSGKYHVWITLPGVNILDLTLQASLIALGRTTGPIHPIIVPGDHPLSDDWTPLYVGTAATEHLIHKSVESFRLRTRNLDIG
jgi:hypothetical protein